jgi:hypothetical protein
MVSASQSGHAALACYRAAGCYRVCLDAQAGPFARVRFPRQADNVRAHDLPPDALPLRFLTRFPYAALLVLVGVSLSAIASRDSVPLVVCGALIAAACVGVIVRYLLARWR